MKRITLLTLLVVGVALLGTATAQSVAKDPNLVNKRTHPAQPFVPLGTSPFCSQPGAPIDSNLPPTTDTMVLAETLVITDLDVSVNITHTWIGDLTIDLTSPIAGTVNLHAVECGNNDDMMGTFDDEAGAIVCASPTVGSFAPTTPGALAAFDGETLSGNWTITVTDGVGGDTGVLNEWCLVTTPVPVELKEFEVE